MSPQPRGASTDLRRADPVDAIVGGGIGGLTAAVALLRAGLDVRVYEQACTLPAVGAGIQLAPNCTRILAGSAAPRSRGWRCGPPPSSSAGGTTGAAVPDAAGRLVDTAYGAPYLHAHRGDLVASWPRPCCGPGRGRPALCRVSTAGSGRRSCSPTARGRSRTWWSGPTASIRPSGRRCSATTGALHRSRRLPRPHARRPTAAPGPGAPLHRSAGARARSSATSWRRPAVNVVCVTEDECVATRVVDRPGATSQDVARPSTAGTCSSGTIVATGRPAQVGPVRPRPLPCWSADVASSATPATRCCRTAARATRAWR